VERPVHERKIMALFDRCRSRFGAVRLLAKVEAPDFGQQATVLARPLITESLMLMELAAADETRRVELVVGWELATLDDLEGLWREGQARGHDVTMRKCIACGTAFVPSQSDAPSRHTG